MQTNDSKIAKKVAQTLFEYVDKEKIGKFLVDANVSEEDLSQAIEECVKSDMFLQLMCDNGIKTMLPVAGPISYAKSIRGTIFIFSESRNHPAFSSMEIVKVT